MLNSTKNIREIKSASMLNQFTAPTVDLLDVALQLRRYQHEIVEKASFENTIAFLPTGAGKTLIACHLISSRINGIRERVPINGKLVAFIAPKKALLSQQLEYIKKNCRMKEVKVKEFTGTTKSNNKLIEYWQKSDWLRELENCEVVGMTPEVMRKLLHQKIVPVKLFDFVVFDECHHILMGKDTMSELCTELVSGDDSYIPLILGLTASPVAKKNTSVGAVMKELQTRMKASFFTPSPETLLCLKEAVNKPTLYTYQFRGNAQEAVSMNDQSLLAVVDIRHHTDQLMSLARARMIHTTHLSSIYDVLVTIKGSPRDFPFLECLELCGEASPLTVFARRSSESHRGATRYKRIRNIESLREIVHQVVEVARDCGVLCALVALEISVTQMSNYNVQTIQLNTVHWTEIQRQGAYHSVQTSKVDTTLLGAKTLEICDGPFFHQLHSVLFDQEVGVNSSLLDLFVALAASVESEVLQNGLETFRRDVSIQSGAVMGRVSSSSFKTICDVMSFFVGVHGASVNIDHTTQHIVLRSGVSSNLQISPSALRLQELLLYLRIACRSLHSSIPVTSLLLRFDVDFSSGAHDASVLPVFATKIEALIDIWRSMSSGNTTDQGPPIAVKVERLVSEVLTTKPVFKSVSSAEWRALSFNTANGEATATGRSNSTLVFCEMILTVKALCFLFDRIREAWNCGNAVTPCPLVPGFLSGDLVLSQQMAVLGQMKDQQINLLFASNVAEEGLDVQSCQLIINYNGAPQTVKSFIQRRGRARAKLSVMVSLISDNKEDSQKMVNSLLTFAAQEQEMDRDLNSFVLSMTDMDVSGGGAYDSPSVSGKGSDTDNSSDADGTRYTVPSTGAHVDTVSSIALVRQYCESLVSSDKRGDAYSTVKPIFVTSVADLTAKVKLFNCSLLLPQGVPPSARCTVILNEVRKRLVEGKVCVAAVAKLHRLGELDDNLRIPLLELVEGNQIQREIEIVSSMKDIRVKTVPDCLYGTIGMQEQRLFMYCFEPTANSVHPIGCFDCDSHFLAATQLGIALRCSVDEEVLIHPIRLSVRKDFTVEVTMRLIGERLCSVEEVYQMSAFHQAMCDMRVGIGGEGDVQWSVDRGHMSFPLPSDLQTLNNRTVFLSHLTECARGASQLAENLQSLRRSGFPLPPLTQLISGEVVSELSGTAPVNQYAGLVVTDHAQRLMVVPQQALNDRRVRLDSVLKTEKTDIADVVGTSAVTYQDQFSKNNKSIEPFFASLSSDPLHHLLPIFEYNKRAPSFSLLRASKRERGKATSYVVPELCKPMGNCRWYYLSLVLPSVTHRVQSLLLSCEARQFLNTEALTANCSTGQPSLSSVLRAITPKMCLEDFDSERLEMLGDSFLKFSMSVHLCRLHPTRNEGFLTSLRGRLVSNLHLCEVAQNMKLDVYLRALPLFGGEAQVVIDENVMQVVAGRDRSVDDQFCTATVKFKTLADLVEAVIGACLVSGGLQSGLRVMRRLGMFEEGDHGDSHSKKRKNSEVENELVVAPSVHVSPVIPQGYDSYLTKIALGGASSVDGVANSSGRANGSNNLGLNILPEQVRALEAVLGYHFRSAANLGEALTHSSVQTRRSNERLEFLGDAVLDYLVVEILFKERTELDQGGLTKAKNDITCNNSLAQFSLKHQLYRYLTVLSPELFGVFNKLFECDATATEELRSIAEPVTKILADLCEALIGAIYVDSGGDLGTLNGVVREIMQMCGF